MTAVQRPQVIKHNNISYYNAKDLKKYDPAFFIGTSRGIREVIKKKNINMTNIHYATLSKKFGWTSVCHQDKPSTKAQLLLLESWVVANIPKMMVGSDESKEEKYEYPEAPSILYLEDAEKFKDDKGNVVEIETRGERNSKGIYFLAKDVAEAFEMPNLIDTVSRKNTNYTIDDYKTFTTQTTEDFRKSCCKRQMFITYEGMIKILYSTQSKKAKTFRDWATDTLFTVQMGKEDQKEELGANLIGQSVNNVRAVFKTCSKKVPCIYRFSLGAAKNLRESMNISITIPDDFIIIKFGLTNDLDRRSLEHVAEYEKIPGVKLGLMDFSYIDPKFLSQAETDIKDFFKTIEIPINYEKYNELIAVNPKHEKQIKKQYEFIATAYQGSITELIIEIERLKNQIDIKDILINQKNIEIELKNEIISLLKKNK